MQRHVPAFLCTARDLRSRTCISTAGAELHSESAVLAAGWRAAAPEADYFLSDKDILTSAASSATEEELRAESAGLGADLQQLREARRQCQAARREAAAAAAAAAAPGRVARGCQQATPYSQFSARCSAQRLSAYKLQGHAVCVIVPVLQLHPGAAAGGATLMRSATEKATWGCEQAATHPSAHFFVQEHCATPFVCIAALGCGFCIKLQEKLLCHGQRPLIGHHAWTWQSLAMSMLHLM